MKHFLFGIIVALNSPMTGGMLAPIKERSMLHVPNNSYFESLRDLLSHLEKIGKLRRITKQVDKDWEIA